MRAEFQIASHRVPHEAGTGDQWTFTFTFTFTWTVYRLSFPKDSGFSHEVERAEALDRTQRLSVHVNVNVNVH